MNKRCPDGQMWCDAIMQAAWPPSPLLGAVVIWRRARSASATWLGGARRTGRRPNRRRLLLDLDTCVGVGAWPLLCSPPQELLEQRQTFFFFWNEKGNFEKIIGWKIRIRKIRGTSFIQSNQTFHVPQDNPRTGFFWGFWKSTLTVHLVLRT
jgi:hypothetical protein